MSTTADLAARVDKLEVAQQQQDARVEQLQTKLEAVKPSQETFYLTTAIHYTNGLPHMGHAYENVCADVISRYHRVFGRDVYFLTGTDEHGQKIAQTAEAAGVTPQQLVDKYAGIFQQLTKDLNMSNNNFIRTTSDVHKKFAQWLFQQALDKGDVYLGTYEGWYNVREEMFVTETEAQLTDYKDPTTGTPFKKMQEQSYFFKMSKYQDRLVKHIEENPEFLQPEVRRQELLRRLQEPLQDLSASRNTFTHGIPILNDPKHVLYVWFDALANYLSAIGYPDGPDARYWPANVHIIGKDITWFHCVIWPCILMSTGIPLPKRVFAHGFVNAKDGSKMSKSVGNVIDPYAMIEKYGLESFRYFIVRSAKFGQDMPFSEDDLINIHNSELADTLGNLVHRTVNICKKYSNGAVPEAKADKPFDIYELLKYSEDSYKDFALQNACIAIVNALKDTNKYLTEKEPWHMKENEPRLVVVRTCLEAIYVLAHYLSPIIPKTAQVIFEKLGTAPTTLTALSPDYDNLKPGTEVSIGGILFNKILTEEEKQKQSEAAAAKAKPAKAKPAKAATPLFASLDIRVGVISKVWKHPESDKLYCEEIDIGEEEPKQIASGLQAFYSLEEMQNRKVLVLLNLKPAKLGGFKSHGMVLCACDEAHENVQFVEPPTDAKVGERVTIASESGEPLSAAQIKKQKVLEKVSPDFVTDDNCVATYKGEQIMTSAGACTAKSLKKAFIS
ncbi:methionine-tRNA ligase [Phytophthora nicotianae INRA-310]|uniref:methionine--tRNA ligase n=2 Tax=Phytophthora nicotianae TaxID=4792 RepID=W2PCB0_PHYN3|nr:methionine-tRNA ligase [Phytophthora nicotianae INRA-310]ETM53543.1 methionine-tRNA ligase [Phytophthora nicotianae]ETM98476.1 methionine-tRNA ligase [Phytophthora nicotianae INRA-310]